jgi:hypothetical protein
VQGLQTGRRHEFLDSCIPYAHHGVVHIRAFGRSVLVLVTPGAQNALVKQQPFIPKPENFYGALRALVYSSAILKKRVLPGLNVNQLACALPAAARLIQARCCCHNGRSQLPVKQHASFCFAVDYLALLS